MSVRAIRPIEITPAMVVESSLFETAPATYNAGTTYALGAYASVAGTLGEILIYKSLQAGNINHTPSSSPTWWVYSSSTYAPYSATVLYGIGDSVLDSSSSQIYQSIAEKNISRPLDPVATPTWVNVGTTTLTDPANWNSGTTYTIGQLVTYVTYNLDSDGLTQPASYLVYKMLNASNTGTAPDAAIFPQPWESLPAYPAPYIYSATYSAGRVVKDSNNNIYKAMFNNSRTLLSNPPAWLKVKPSNRTAMFDGEVSSQSVANLEMSTTIFTGVIDTLALVGLQGGVATVAVRDGFGGTIVYEQSQGISGEIVADWWAFLYGDASIPLRKAVFTELPPYVNAHVTIKIVGDGEVRLGAIAAGVQSEIGLGASYGANIEVKDYSVKTTGDFGKTKFVKRGFKEVLELSVLLEKTEFNRVHNTFINLRSEPWFLIVADDHDLSEALYMYGFYNSYRNVIEYPTATIYSLQFESLVS